VILCIYAAQKLMLGCYLLQQVWRNRSACLTYFERVAVKACPMWKARSTWLQDGR